MTSSDSTTPDETTDPVAEQDAIDGETSPAEIAEEAEERAPASHARKPAGAKEVIPFQWKLIGEAHGVALTLFKAIERADVEAQLERVNREGYYRNLRILELAEKVKQPSGGDARTLALVGAKTETNTNRAKTRHSPTASKKRKRPTDAESAAPPATGRTAKTAKVVRVAAVSKPAKVGRLAKTTKPPKKAKITKKTKPAKPSKSTKLGKTKTTKTPKAKKATKTTKKTSRKKTTSAKRATKKRVAKKK